MNDPTASTTLDDFLNLDLVAATGGLDTNATATSTDFHDLFSPRLSDASPSSATTFLPPNTPPQPMQSQTAMDTLNPNHVVFGDLYNTYIEPLRRGYFSKPSTSSSGANLADGAFAFNDLFASYSNDGTFNLFPPASSSDSTAPSNTTTAPLALPFTIDPQLVATPAPSHASPLLSTDNEAVPASNHKSSPLAAISAPVAPPTKSNSVPRADTVSVMDDDDSEDDEDDEDDDDLPTSPSSAKAKAKAKKGVAAGGVTKRTQVTSCVVREADSNDPDDWRPTAEEYKKLSSKEKRQLRNKISARNFRVRRKEYITTLEGQISDRDKLISAIREELGAQKMENAELRQEIDNLKKAMLDGRAPLPTGLPPPSATSSISPGPSRRSAATPLTKANPNKDVGGSGSFWGGAIGMGGVTSVHTMVVPEFPVMANVLAGKGPRNWGLPLSTATLGTLPGHSARHSQDNINPNMNLRPTASPVSSSSTSSSSSSEGESPSSGSSSESPISTPPQSPPLNLISNNTNLQQQPWNGVSDINPFTIKTLDSYRMQLWSKMAAAGHVPQQQQPSLQQQALFNTYSTSAAGGPSSLAGHLRPAFFDTPDSSASASSSSSSSKKPNSSLSALLAGKTASNLAASSSATLPSSSSSASPAQQAQQYAAAASLVSRMSSAFRDAFAQPSASSSSLTSSSSSSASAAKAWDMEKVRKVLEGKAVLKVVDVDQLQPPAAPTAVAAASSALKKSPMLRAKSVDPGLEEKMSRLSLNMTTGLSREDREVDSSLTPLAHPSAMKPSAFKTLLK
ncbi:hypothetical protein M407DRAFT_17372 [Tulasnella calospora MUT 4182]|uniref:BZIP domain-containing protein n=1 Tax=Tulasnella calospora MUT 4182 TaxID=1051891 RepID=A0A0C3QVS2_9AGAM|nr:hypothetical protein M407DRAFT_17372 [Tulasnella calospora MUT 4182]